MALRFTFVERNLVKHQKVSKYYDHDCRFNVLYSRNYFPKIKDGAYVINIDE